VKYAPIIIVLEITNYLQWNFCLLSFAMIQVMGVKENAAGCCESLRLLLGNVWFIVASYWLWTLTFQRLNELHHTWPT
jgi:hypothetical protein